MKRIAPIFLVILCSASAQTTDPAPLASARAAFLRDVLASSKTLSGQYESALARAEAELAAAAEYEEALLVRRRRDELKALYPVTGAEIAASLAIPLPARQARLSGSVEARGEELTQWRTNGSSAEWTGVKVSPGRYYLELEACLIETAPPPDGMLPGLFRPQEHVTFEFHELSLLPGAAENRRSFEIAPVRADGAFTSLQAGPVTFTRSPVSLRLTAAAGYPARHIRLRALRLIPAAQDAPTIVSPDSSTPTLDDLRKSLSETLAAVQKPIVDGYLQSLRDLAAGTPALKDAADAEARRIIRMLQDNGRSTQRLLGAATPLSAFDDLDGAVFVPDPANEGDRFFVEHDGSRLRVQLLWVECAPVDAARDADRAGRIREHFRIEDTDSPARLAREFTAGYLEGKPLRLLVRPGKNKDGSISALVFLPEVGLYQNILVDQGLAAVIAPREKRGVSETGLHDSLLARERAAQRRKPAPGAWALSEGARR